MKIFVCVKAVPESDSIAFDQETGHLKRQGSTAMINPCDLVAMEAALRCAEAYGGTVQAVSMGPDSAESALRTALAMGATHAHLLTSKVFSGADVPATAYTLSAFFKAAGSYDMIFCGKHSSDGDTGQVGAWLAELLGIPHACAVCRISDVGDSVVRAAQNIDSELLETVLPLPCLLTIENDMYYPRIPTLVNTLRAKRQDIACYNEESIPRLDPSQCGVSGSATRVKKVFVPNRMRRGMMLGQDQLELLLPILRVGRAG